MSNPLSSLIRRLTGQAPVQTPAADQGPAAGDIAVIGMACRVPGAADYQAFWENLAARRNSVDEIPASRWDWREYWGDPASEVNKSDARHAGCIDQVEAFDAKFFGISPASAHNMDPQQRIMLELSWHCLEDAGVLPSALAGSRTGVFIAAFNYDYKELLEGAGLPIEAYQSTGSAAAVIANRISHGFDLRGPSVLVDTACSGSLSAIHQALQSLRLGESELALAGGINLLLTPTRHISFAKTGMLSPSGSCKSFDEAADGYVRSEGAGVLLLKPLARALEDGDPIHGIIKGSAVNHCGKTHTLTYPSAQAQAAVIRAALDDARVAASSISYIEAHGTGTPKGDPIEIQGLSEAFAGAGESIAGQTCGIGSAKSNIGHLEAAAGVAGVIKVLLSFKAGQLPPLCHFARLNPRIELRDSPFYPVAHLQPWQALPAGAGEAPVRRAGVSSFGFGGTNAHLVLEQARVVEPLPVTSTAPGWLIALSAKSEAGLRRQCTQLRDWLQGSGAQVALGAISQVLLTGREAMAYREAWVVRDKDELIRLLDNAAQASVANPVHSETDLSGREEAAQRLVQALSSEAARGSEPYLRQLNELAGHFLAGATIAFAGLFAGQPRRHLGLPGYAFARDRYWLPVAEVRGPATGHFLSIAEPSLADHVIADRHWVAGAVLLAVAAKAWGAGAGTALRFDRVVWLQPLALTGEGARVQVDLRRDGALSEFDVRADGLGHPLCSASIEALPVVPVLRDIAALRQRHGAAQLEGEALYARLRKVGMAYGPSYRALQQSWLDGNGSLLGRIVLPPAQSETAFPFAPQALDAAFQAALLLALELSGEGVRLGFSVGQLQIMGGLPERFWVQVTRRSASTGHWSFDIEWIGDDGRLCASATDFVLKAGAAAPKAHLCAVEWVAQDASQWLPSSPVEVGYTVVVGADERQADEWRRPFGSVLFLPAPVEASGQDWQRALSELAPFERLVWLAPEGCGEPWHAQSLIEAQDAGVMALFALCQGLFLVGLRQRPLELWVATTQALQVGSGQAHDPTHAAVHGLAGTLARECPSWQVRLADFQQQQPQPLDAFRCLPPQPAALSRAWRDGQWYQQALLPVDYPEVAPAYRQGGCYLIIGGAGGIGVAWTQRLIREHGAHVYWIGRRPLDENIRRDIQRLAGEGPAPTYLCADARDPKALAEAIERIRKQHGQLHGVIHAAMLMRGKSLERMDRETFRQVLSAKVDTGAALAEALCDEPLDFLLFFSSINAFERIANQGNYAAGCVFIDELAASLAQRLACRVAVIDWGYWSEVGALAGSAALEVLREREGTAPVELLPAMRAADFVLSGPLLHVAVTGSAAARPSGLELPDRQISLVPAGQDSVATTIRLFEAALNGRGSTQLRGGLTLPGLEALLCQVLLVQLCEAGLFAEPVGYSLDALYQRLQARAEGPVGVDRRWLEYSLKWLVQQGYLRSDEAAEPCYEALDETPVAEVWSAWDQALRDGQADPDRRAQVQLLDACLRALPAVLGGRTRATAVMFPEASMARVEGIYKHNAVSDYFNDVLTQAVLARVRAGRESAAAPVRILEIGAGTGGTSARVFEGLDGLGIEVGEYLYTDVSRAFLLHGQEAYGAGRPYLTYRLLDIEKDLVGQGLEIGGYDLVIATNVLHATADIRQVLRHAKAALKGDGWLLLNELSEASLFSHLTFGLLEGWWRYRDEALRLPGSPGLSSENWQRVLEEEGYRGVGFPARAFHGLGQQVIMARSDGVVRHARRVSPVQPPAVVEEAVTAVAEVAPAAQDNRQQVMQTLREVLAASLQFELADIRDDEPFADYGVDSITGVSAVRQLNTRLGLDLYTTCLFDYTSIERLAGYIVAQYPQLNVAAVPTTPPPEPQAQSRVEAPAPAPASDDTAIAIVGVSGRFPRSRNLEAFWTHLAAGENLVGRVERWDPQDCHPGMDPQAACASGGFVDGIEYFDPLFFNISPLEATYMDPQQRLFLQEAWNALADAGCMGERRRSDVSVYVGCEQGDYESLFSAGPPPQSFWGNAPSIIPARIAYYLDLQGPAIAVDTACSSSLVAIHMACQSLLAGDTAIGLAGGVFIQSTPAFYQKANRANMLSASGACHTFDSRADGFVPGEGVGVVVLKRLADALADRDHIHGLIRGSAINQDGASNGITAPSALSQQRLHESVHERFAIDPQSIQLVEAHGTGTRLGDPIEFKALNAAFSRTTSRKGYCAIGSVKSNMGHAATAAAMAGLFKLLLGMRHRQMPASLHFEQANPAIDFTASPFFVNTRLRDWPAGEGQPRRAAISSFGFSGTNAHMVVEQAPSRLRPPSQVPLVLIGLDARTPEQLRQRVAELLGFCQQDNDFALLDISYSLLTGRQRFEYRFLTLAVDRGELIGALQDWLQAYPPGVDTFAEAPLACHERLLHRVEEAAGQARSYLASLCAPALAFSRGEAADFSNVFNELDCQRLPLPGYPFARERYWVSDASADVPLLTSRVQASRAHPMGGAALVEDAADFEWTFDGDEYFLAQHRIGGQRVMPGVAFLEMVGVAQRQRHQAPETATLSLVNLAWQEPLRVTEASTRVRIRFNPPALAGGFDSFTLAGTDGARLHCLGHCAVDEVAPPAPLDLENLKQLCSASVLGAEQCYRHFESVGIDYGPAFRGVEQSSVSAGHGAGAQLLARLERRADAGPGWRLEPGMADAALQAAAHWLVHDWPTPEALVPFSLERFDLFGTCGPRMWAHVVRREVLGRSAIPALDISLADESGRVCARFSGLTFRAAGRPQGPDRGPTLWSEKWTPAQTSSGAGSEPVEDRLVIVAIAPARLQAERALAGLPWVRLVEQDLPLGEGYVQAAIALMTQLQSRIRNGGGRTLHLQLLVEAGDRQGLNDGLLGMLSSVAQEYPALKPQCLILDIESPEKDWAAALDSALTLGQTRLRWRHGRWEGSAWQPLPVQPAVAPWKSAGVYLITGGLGGLGRVLAQDIVRHAPGATLILATRQVAAAPGPEALERLYGSTARIDIRALDVSDLAATQRLVEQVLQRYGRLDGVLHVAGVTRDGYLLHKTGQALAEVFAPKVQGVLNLDSATAALKLDVFLLFSSISAQLGNVGQADYAAANRFMDGFARLRASEVERGLRSGTSLSIAWPYWEEGGLRIDAPSLARLHTAWGLTPMPSAVGLQVLYQALGQSQANLLVLYGVQAQARALLGETGAGPAPVEALATSALEPLEPWLCATAALLAGVPEADIDPEQPFADYGFDRVQREELFRRLAEHLDLAPHSLALSHCSCLREVCAQCAGHLPAASSIAAMEYPLTVDTHTATPTPNAQAFILALLRKLLVSVTRVAPEQLQDSRHFEHYGIDSLMVVQMTTELEKSFGALSKTLFFEHGSIEELAAYFLLRHGARLNELAPDAPSTFTPFVAQVPLPPVVTASAAVVAPSGSTSTPEPIAIVGLSGRYPQAANLQVFWQNLVEGLDCITEVPAQRWDPAQVLKPEGKLLSRWGGFIDGVDQFDPLFFNISPHDAEFMDPQERLFLQCAYETFEDAGLAQGLRSQGEAGRTGVYVGVMYQEYQLYGAEQTLLGRPMALSGSSASIANRVSWCLGLKGPSLAVDSMCSASLTAIHLACQGLRSGDCEVALAGGVNVNLHPNKYLGLAQGNFASSRGRCESFGAGGDGYVPAEGVGAVLLKPLSKALADGDRIYALVRGSQINHGGKANGFTVPNPNAQAQVISQALAAAAVDPRQVGYVEAHGTGTALGDPIELAGLAKAYGQRGPGEGRCALGSVKSNIGHCESAAGIAGLTKVLLQMRHGQLVPSLHSSELNPAIDFEHSPFVVQRELADWPRPTRQVDGVVRECPRLAGLSSFGAGGSNAHLIIEEYPLAAREVVPAAQQRPLPILLSAANAERLRELAERYLGFCDVAPGQGLLFEDLAYTLRTGREALNERLAFMAGSWEELRARLHEYLHERGEAGTLYSGSCRHGDSSVARLLGDDDLSRLQRQWVAAGRFEKLLELWINGVAIDWAALLESQGGRKVSLPTYPFARERYWYTDIHPDGPAINSLPGRHEVPVAGPLALVNSSGLEGLSYTTRVDGEESFLADHRVRGRRMMAGVAYLELARKALFQAGAQDVDGAAGLRLSDVFWLAPVVVEAEPVSLKIRLQPGSGGAVEFEILQGDGASRVPGGEAIKARGTLQRLALETPPRIDPQALLAQLRSAPGVQQPTSAQFYETFARLGIDYGPSHRCLSHLYSSEEQVLALIELTPGDLLSLERQPLHPSILDAALQATQLLNRGEQPLRVPFALGELLAYAPCAARMWVSARHSQGRDGYDLELFDEQGTLCVSLKGLRVREWSASVTMDAALDTHSLPAGDLLLAPDWAPLALQPGKISTAATLVIGADGPALEALRATGVNGLECRVALDDSVEQLLARFQALPPFDRLVLLLAPGSARSLGDERLVEEQQALARQQLRLVQALLRCGFDKQALHYVVITRDAWSADAAQPAHAGIHGLAGSLAKEMPHWTVQALDLEQATALPWEQVFNVPVQGEETSRRLRDGVWWARQLVLYRPSANTTPVYRQGGVYVVIGGSGGLGRVWTEVVARDLAAQVVWLGRRPLDASIEASLDDIARHGPRPLYLSVDATDSRQLQQANETILQRFGRIDGLVHSAIVLDDRGLANMSETQLQRSLAAKVDVSVRMAQVFARQPLDFVLFFSSLIAFTRNAGQANYALGCSFKDMFAARWRQESRVPVKTMNWGYWGGTGVVASDAYRQRMAREGIGSIEPREAMQAIETLLAGPLDQLAFIKTLAPVALPGSDASRQWLGQPSVSAVALDIEPAVQAWVSARDRHAAGLLERYRDGARQHQAPLCQVLLVQLREAGLFAEPGGYSLDALYQRLQARAQGPVGVDRRWLEHSLKWLAVQGYLSGDAALEPRYTLLRGIPAAEAWAAWEQVLGEGEANPDRRAQVQLLDACLRALPAVLGGRTRATQVIFPDSSMALVEGIYKHNAVSDYFNDVLIQAVLARVRAGRENATVPVRILEIGAGTGGTSARLLEALDGLGIEVGEYAYTDVSRAFLLHGQEAYGAGRPYLAYRLLDIEKDLIGQGLEIGGYDLVIATNVLHATADIRQVLRHAKAALKGDGWLLLNELSEASLFSHLTFGLLEGWWRYRDETLRLPGSPGLSSENWQRVLEDEGYRGVGFPAQSFHGLGQQVIMARSDGVARLSRQVAQVPVVAPTVAIDSGQSQAAAVRPEPVAAAVDLRAGVRQVVMACVATALKVALEVIEPDESFSDYGLDSITGVNLVRVLDEQLGINLGTTALFDFSTATRLATHIVEQHGASLRLPGVATSASPAVAPVPVQPSVSSAPAAEPWPVARPEVAEEKPPARPSFEREPIAIIGMSGRFPQADSLEQLWQHLAAGHDLTRPVRRWDLASGDDAEPARGRCNRGGLLERIDGFDPLFFNISGLEASCMDPQQRLFLEESWTALEDAGYVADAVAGRKVGVYVGCSAGDYRSLFVETPPAQAFWGNASSIVPARIAYYLDLQGPAIAVDTACSSSLVAIHLACQALWTSEIEMALAGGVFVQSTAAFYQSAQNAGMLSPTGHCHSFDQRADGFVPAEGVGVVILKRLSQAQADGDNIQAVISGSGINQDGASNGITAPSARSQERLIRQVHEDFAIAPASISLVEAHGTGTPLGDPIEFEGLKRAFGDEGGRNGYCALGSIKANLGHCVTAAGVAGVLKVALALRHGQLPPAAGFAVGNPAIDFARSPFFVNRQLSAWNGIDGGVRRATVSSFGFSGTNAHLVMQQPPLPVLRGGESSPPWLIVLSARSVAQLRQQAENLLGYAATQASLDTAAVAFTLMVGRKHHEFRLALVVTDAAQLLACLRDWLKGRESAAVQVGHWEARSFVEQPAVLEAARAALIRLAGNRDAQARGEALATVAQAFVQGYGLDYPSLFTPAERRRLSLPTYPFERQSYWVAPAFQAPSTVAPVVVKEETPNSWLFCEEQWREQDLPASLDWSARIKALSGAHVAVVTSQPQRFGAFARLIEALWAQAASTAPTLEHLDPRIGSNSGRLPDAVFFLGHAATAGQVPQPGALDEIEAVFQVSRRLMAADWEHAVEYFHVHGPALATSECDGQALYGFARSATLENSHHGWTLLQHQADAQADDLQLIVREWLAGERQGSEVAMLRYQGTQRLRRHLVQRPRAEGEVQRFRRHGHYLLVGGLGPVGELLCQELARTFQARLSIVSRSAPDAELQARCDVLRALGASVHYSAVDITDRAALQAVVEQRVGAVGELHGVIHLARLVDDGLIVDKTWAAFQRSIAAKVQGTINLDQVTARQPLDFFMLFSSMAAYGIRGSADYGYAAAFQNAFVGHRQRLERQGERRGVSMAHCWGAWCVDRYMPDNRPAHLQALGLGLIDIQSAFAYLHASPDSGVVGALAVVDAAQACRGLGIEPLSDPAATVSSPLASLHAQLLAWEQQCRDGSILDPAVWCQVVGAHDLDLLDEATIDRLDRLFFAGEATAPMPDEAPAVRASTLAQVREVVARVLQVPDPDLDESFPRYGLDSVGAMQVASALSRALGRIVEPRWLVQYATIRTLAGYLQTTAEGALK